MSDYLPDSPVVARAFCPGCEQEPFDAKEVLDIRWCDTHAPSRDGLDDAAVGLQGYMSGSAEAGGDDNKRWCDLFHRSAT